MMTNNVALVTATDRGLGFETSRQLAQQGVSFLIGCRSTGKGRVAARELISARKSLLVSKFFPLFIWVENPVP